jgi:hypothetical protein
MELDCDLGDVPKVRRSETCKCADFHTFDIHLKKVDMSERQIVKKIVKDYALDFVFSFDACSIYRPVDSRGVVPFKEGQGGRAVRVADSKLYYPVGSSLSSDLGGQSSVWLHRDAASIVQRRHCCGELAPVSAKVHHDRGRRESICQVGVPQYPIC